MKLPAMKQYLAAFIFFATFIPVSSFAWTGKVVSVTDGDTIRVLHKGKVKNIELYGIDAPDKKQNFGKKARDFVSSFVNGENVEVERKGLTRYGRTEALISISGETINQLMVLNGYARVNRQSCKEKFCVDWIKMEEAAKQEKKGLWSDPTITVPKEYQHPKKK